jgi:hypothetical protein
MAPPVMTDPTGALLVEIRDYLAAEGVTTRVRPTEPEPGDARRFGEYVRFVVLVALSLPPDPMLPTMDATFAVRCYGTNPVDASLVWRYVADAVHRIGPRVGTSGIGIYRSWMTDGTPDKDPDTQQPFVNGVIRLLATTQAVAA